MSNAALTRLHLAFGDNDRELAVTRRMLARVPDEHFDWRPHEKSWTLGELACHIVDLLWWQVVTLDRDGIDMAEPWPKTSAKSQAELLDAFDANAAVLRATLEGTTEADLAAPWTLSYGKNEILTEPKGDVLRVYGISHSAHHRGQLTVYLRMLDIPLPPSYGPTADEQA